MSDCTCDEEHRSTACPEHGTDGIEPWGCLWCGLEDPDTVGVPEEQRSVNAHELWLHLHVTECERRPE